MCGVVDVPERSLRVVGLEDKIVQSNIIRVGSSRADAFSRDKKCGST